MKRLLLFLAALLLVGMVMADDVETQGHWLASQETWSAFNTGVADMPPGGVTIIQTSGTGGTGGLGVPKYYDVVCRTIKATYADGPIDATCSIKLMSRDIPQDDGLLQYWVITPSNKVLPWKQEQIAEGTHENLALSYNLPANAEEGAYTFVARWITPDVNVITAMDVFNLQHQHLNPTITILVILVGASGIIGIIVLTSKKKDEDD